MSESPIAQWGTPPKSRLIYVLLALFLGALGIHNFYAGYVARALVQLGITLCLGWLLVPELFVGIWVLAEIFFVTRDAYGQPFEGSGCAVFIGLIALIIISIFAALLWIRWYAPSEPPAATPISAPALTP